VYTQHLLLEAADRGERVPGDLLANGNNYLRTLAARDGNNLTEERQSAYAIYLLTRQGQRMTSQIVAARKRLEERHRDVWKQDLAAAWLAASLDLMKQDRDAESLIDPIAFGAGSADDLYHDPMTRDAQLLYVMARHFPELLGRRSNDALTRLAERVNEGIYHSLSAGTTLLALDAYTSAVQRTAASLGIAEILKDKRVRALTLPKETFPEVAFSDQADGLRFRNNSSLNAYYMFEQTGFDRAPPQQAIKQGLEILREYTDAQGKLLAQVQLGQQVDVHLKFRSLKRDFVPSVALVDLLPGGFELVMPQVPASAEFAEGSPASEDEESELDDYDVHRPEGDDSDHYDSAGTGWSCSFCTARNASLDYADAREDRVVFYAGANRNLGEVVYRIKATNVGSYVVPPAYGEAMYDRATIGRSTAGRVDVVRP
jgi:uncharacterized protein YfaS (alpha-2-macroglobulin family)